MTTLERVRAALPGEPRVRERNMFGSICFLLDDRMVVAVDRQERLMVRIDHARDAELLTRPGARRPEMGAGRSMGPGWIRVDVDAIEEPADFDAWMAEALDFHARATAS